MKRYLALAVVAPLIGTWATVRARLPQSDDDVRLNVVVSDTGNLRSDGKGAYITGKDHIAAWLNPTRWPAMSFDICMNWPFAKYPGLGSDTASRPSGTAGDRTLLHRMTDPVPGAGGRPRGVFSGPGGSNDVALAKPLTTTVRSLTDLAVGASVSAQSAEVRFCNADCSEYYSVIFGEKSAFGYPKIHGAGTTRPIVTRTSARTWTINFPPGTMGRLWNRSGDVTDLGLYYYQGQLALQRQ